DGIRDRTVTGVQTCALPISRAVTDVHEEQKHEHHLRDGDCDRDHGVHRPEVYLSGEDCYRREDEQRGEDRVVSFARDDVNRHKQIGRASCREKGKSWEWWLL